MKTWSNSLLIHNPRITLRSWFHPKADFWVRHWVLSCNLRLIVTQTLTPSRICTSKRTENTVKMVWWEIFGCTTCSMSEITHFSHIKHLLWQFTSYNIFKHVAKFCPLECYCSQNFIAAWKIDCIVNCCIGYFSIEIYSWGVIAQKNWNVHQEAGISYILVHFCQFGSRRVIGWPYIDTGHTITCNEVLKWNFVFSLHKPNVSLQPTNIISKVWNGIQRSWVVWIWTYNVRYVKQLHNSLFLPASLRQVWLMSGHFLTASGWLVWLMWDYIICNGESKRKLVIV